MLNENIIKNEGFRPLDGAELDAVSGGNLPIIYSGGFTVFGGGSSGTTSSGAYSVGNGDGAGGIGSGLSSFQMMDLAAIATLADFDFEDFDPQQAFADYLEENGLEDLWIDANGDGLHDITGEGRPIVVTGDSSPYQGVPEGYIRAPGTDLYMYPLGPNGLPDTSNGPEFTPEGLEHACETHQQAEESINEVAFWIGMFGNLSFIPFLNAAAPPVAVANGTLSILGQSEPLDHCE
jgi:hypothetical protein